MFVSEDARMCYELRGASEHAAILFLHGFMGDRQEFGWVASALSPAFQILCLDLPGHGDTQVKNVSSYNLFQTASLVIGLLDELDIHRCFLVGYSMGGRLALYLALKFPDRFIKVLLESASPGLKTVAERQDRQVRDERLARELETLELADFLQKWYAQPMFAVTRRSPRFAELLGRRLQNRPVELARSLRYLGTGSQPSLWNELVNGAVPLVLMVGELDQKFVQINQEMQRICQGANAPAQLQIVPGCGHTIHFENASEFLQRLQEFLR